MKASFYSKIFILSFALFFLSVNIGLSKEVNFSVNNETFSSAKNNRNQLQFSVTSTKVGLFSSDVPGYVKNFNVKYDIRNEMMIQNANISFAIDSMDTDNTTRDEKMKNLCLGMSQFQRIEVRINKPFSLKDNDEFNIPGEVLIRGKWNPITIGVVVKKEGKELMLKMTSEWSLQKLSIPDPSILVAKLSDEIKINATIYIQN